MRARPFQKTHLGGMEDFVQDAPRKNRISGIASSPVCGRWRTALSCWNDAFRWNTAEGSKDKVEGRLVDA